MIFYAVLYVIKSLALKEESRLKIFGTKRGMEKT
jgi:hypothetical protein